MKQQICVGLVIGSVFLSGCNVGDKDADQRLKDRVGQEAEQTQIKAKEAREDLANEMEADLLRRHAFMQSIKGTFRGSYAVDDMNFKIEVSLYPNLNPVNYDRVRTPEEVNEDLSNLTLNVQVRQWLDGNTESSSGCRIEGIHPDWLAGQIQIISQSCPNMFVFVLTEDEIDINLSKNDLYANAVKDAPLLSKRIMNEELNIVTKLMGLIRPTLNAKTNLFVLERDSQ